MECIGQSGESERERERERDLLGARVRLLPSRWSESEVYTTMKPYFDKLVHTP